MVSRSCLPLASFSQSDITVLIAELDELQRRFPDDSRSDRRGTIALTFRSTEIGETTYRATILHNSVALDGLLVDVSDKKSGGNLKVRFSSADETPYLVLLTVTDPDTTSYHIRRVSQQPDDFGYVHISRQKTVINVYVLPNSLAYYRDVLVRQHASFESGRPSHSLSARPTPAISDVPPPVRQRKTRRHRNNSDDHEGFSRKCFLKITFYALIVFYVSSAAWNFSVAPSQSSEVARNTSKITLTKERIRMFQRFFTAFYELAEKEPVVHRWLLGARLRNRFDYVDQLTALMHDGLIAIDKLERIVDIPRPEDHAREVVWRLGLIDKRFASANLVHKQGDANAEYSDLALLCHLIFGHITEILLQLPRQDYGWIDESLLEDAMGIRHWVSRRWHRTGTGRILPSNADYVEPWAYQSYYESWPKI